MRKGTHQTEESRRLIAEGIRAVHQARREREALAVYAADEALESLDELTAWLRGEGRDEDEDKIVDRAARAMHLLARVVSEEGGAES